MWNIVYLSLAFLALFSIAEWFYHRWNIQVEYTRKLVHIGTGLLTLLFPVLLHSHWEVLFLCGSFAVILISSQKLGFLPSINAIERKSHGSICYPTAVYLIFLAFQWVSQRGTETVPPLLYYYIPILTMALCDPVAALTGKKWPLKKFRVGSGAKSIGGTAAFFLVAFCLTAALMILFQGGNYSWSKVLSVSFILAGATCTTEAFTPNGFDNLTIPGIAFITLFSLNNWI